MPCYNPMQVNFSVIDGKKIIDFSSVTPIRNFIDGVPHFFPESVMALPCGACIGCRLEHSRQWAMRIMHESEMHEHNCFLTLTYAPEHLPSDNSLHKKHFVDFMKRLRIAVSRGTHPAFVSDGVRYYHCGEYGERFARPHYHACMFGLRLLDLEQFKSGKFPLFTSKTLTDLWGFGYVVVGELTFESSAYVARYCTKKITGQKAPDHYQGRQPEYSTMSRRPGIGATWYEKYKNDIYPDDFLVVRGHKCGVPRFYDKLLDRENPDLLLQLKQDRLLRARENPDNTYERLKIREFCVSDKFYRKIRSYESLYD